MAKVSYEIRVCGLVQGVGFRPFIYKLAFANKIAGTVENNNEGVLIIAEGEEETIIKFCNSIRSEAPVASSISDIFITRKEPNGYKNFQIIKSRSYSDEVTEVSPDIAVCDACLQDMKAQPHRINYPFVNCTNCGPRFTIIRDLPYDRPKTTMALFKMCPQCEKEYKDVLDRRFHAQPVACNTCGPHYTLHIDGKETIDLQQILAETSRLISEGKIIAIKGLGGFHLACDAQNELAPSISIGLNTVGAMLPYMPFHHLLFEYLTIPALVMTSGNLSDEPILIDNQTALENFAPITDAIITYNRDIHNRTDDSVCMVINHKERVIRRSRSFVPSPISRKTGLNKVALSGGTFQNKILLAKAENELQAAGYEVYSHSLVPSNDGGIALGQLAIAAKQRIMKEKIDI